MPAQQLNFTKKALVALPSAPSGKRVYYRDTRYSQLYLQITDTGHKSFQVYAWGAGRPQRVTLGQFDPTNHAALTIEQARRKVAPMLKKIQGGRIPVAEKRAHRQAETVKELADEYLERHAKPKKKSWKEDERQINKDILPQWRNRKAREITRRDVTKLIERIADRGADIQARRTYRLLSRMFKFGVGRAILDASPCIEVELPGKETPRTRNLSSAEVAIVWPKLDPQDVSLLMDPRLKLLLRLIIVTGQRPGECRQMEWGQIEGHWWIIPIPNVKNTTGKDMREHRVYLASYALEILDEAKKLSDGCRYVFTSTRGDKPMTVSAISRAVARNLAAFEVEKFTPHDLRRTASSRMAEAGINAEIIDRVLGHAQPGMRRVYNIYDYDKEKRQVLEKWDRRLREIITGEKRGKVVPMRTAR